MLAGANSREVVASLTRMGRLAKASEAMSQSVTEPGCGSGWKILLKFTWPRKATGPDNPLKKASWSAEPRVSFRDTSHEGCGSITLRLDVAGPALAATPCSSTSTSISGTWAMGDPPGGAPGEGRVMAYGTGSVWGGIRNTMVR